MKPVVRLTNAEAIKMGLMAAEPEAPMQTGTNMGILSFLIFLFGWVLGFVMGLAF